jgi:hypothetical protein
MVGDRMRFLDCPAYLDEEGTQRCGLPAEVTCSYVVNSTDGPLESAMIRCPSGHWFNGPIEFLVPPAHPRASTDTHLSLKDTFGGRAA